MRPLIGCPIWGGAYLERSGSCYRGSFNVLVRLERPRQKRRATDAGSFKTSGRRGSEV